MTPIPFLLLGDGPAEPTGLGRIARDLASQILRSDLPFDLVQVGGGSLPLWKDWRHVPLDRAEDWGASCVQQIYQQLWGDTPGILFAVWDPSRLFSYAQIDLPVQKWAYCAIDGENCRGEISGPAREAVLRFDRVLAYGKYGAEVLKRTVGVPQQWLPHGVELSTYGPLEDEARGWAAARLGPHAIGKTMIGCVMTNQPRKDFGLLFETLAMLKAEGINPYLWLHTDELVKAWSVQQLVEDFGLGRLVTVTGLGEPMSDQQLAALYQVCKVTILPSLGEGFGYPIVESLASGIPCVHSDCAEGRNYIPRVEWRVPVRESRLESVYGIKRPVMRAEDWRNATLRALKWAEVEGSTGKEYLRGAVAQLDWAALWPRWRSWFRQGVGSAR
jgi:glycosyltransferase involved in cell wall biosynthesis